MLQAFTSIIFNPKTSREGIPSSGDFFLEFIIKCTFWEEAFIYRLREYWLFDHLEHFIVIVFLYSWQLLISEMKCRQLVTCHQSHMSLVTHVTWYMWRIIQSHINTMSLSIMISMELLNHLGAGPVCLCEFTEVWKININNIYVPPDCSQRLVHLNAPIYFHLWMTSAQ